VRTANCVTHSAWRVTGRARFNVELWRGCGAPPDPFLRPAPGGGVHCAKSASHTHTPSFRMSCLLSNVSSATCVCVCVCACVCVCVCCFVL